MVKVVLKKLFNHLTLIWQLDPSRFQNPTKNPEVREKWKHKKHQSVH